MDYEYDVFISYRNDKFFSSWVHDVLYETLEPLLRNALGKGEVKIFLDKEEITSGDDWKKRIQKALITSRCMIPVLIPDYFNREWCIREFAVMLHRQRELGYNTLQNPTGLIHPIHLFDGDLFPDYAKDIQAKIFNDYFYPSEGFNKMPIYNDFFKDMKDWVFEIAKAVNNAPEWNDEWLQPDWLDEPYNTLKAQTKSPKPHAPKL